MRKWWVILVVVGVSAAAPLAVLAATGSFGSVLNRQRAFFTTNSVSTASPVFHTVPGLGAIRICAGNTSSPEIALTLSVNVDGPPVRFRVLEDGGPVLEPGAARFVPAAGGESFSYTFVGRASTFEGSDRHALTVEWASPTGGKVTLSRGDANVLFQQGSSC